MRFVSPFYRTKVTDKDNVTLGQIFREPFPRGLACVHFILSQSSNLALHLLIVKVKVLHMSS